MSSSSSSSSSFVPPLKLEPLAETFLHYRSAIDSLRSSLGPAASDPLVDDLFLYRFLRGYNFHPSKSLDAVSRALEARTQHDLNTIRTKCDIPQFSFPHGRELAKYFPHTISHGFDVSGQPVSYERLGLVNPSLFLNSISLAQFMDYHRYHTEYKSKLVAKLSSDQGRVVRLTKVTDLRGLSSSHFSHGIFVYLKTIAEFSQLVYPEMLADWYIVNTPKLFHFAWKLVKPLLSESTLSKIHICGENFMQELEKTIDKQNIPTFLGGKCECDGGCVPCLDPFEGMKPVEISARGKKDAIIEFTPEMKQAIKQSAEQKDKENKQKLELFYEFRTKAKDIQFELHLLSDGGDRDVIRANKRFQADKELVGELIDLQAEIYKISQKSNAKAGKDYVGAVLVFDNSYSYFTGKEVYYRVDQVVRAVEDSEQEKQQEEIEREMKMAEEQEKQSESEGSSSGV